jgi:D-lactate dehydrogenase
MMLNSVLPKERVSIRLIDRLAYAHDASMYRLVPEAVVRPRNDKDVSALMKHCYSNKIPVTFRAGGTSLSGQSVTKGILAETVRDWKSFKILENGDKIRLQPGIIGSHANRYLAPYGRKIGPDPASMDACMIGGIVSNNSSGMICGTQFNAYHTLDSIRFILAHGHLYNTDNKEDRERFLSEESDLCDAIHQCKFQIESSPILMKKIRNKYRIKNTIGYSLNAFLDYDNPLDIFAHLLVGSEGTLAFISEVVLNTIPNPLVKSTGLLLFESIHDACESIPMLIEKNASAVELMDYASLCTISYRDNPIYDRTILNKNSTGMLIEFHGDDKETVNAMCNAIQLELKQESKILQNFSSETQIRNRIWEIRKGLYPTVGSLRKSGTTLITEDICVDYSRMPEAVDSLVELFQKWTFKDAVIFGHAKDGNLHFVSSVDLNTSTGISRFDGLMRDIAEMTLTTFDGSLKAEHGTGRNMAPFVEAEWGGELYDIMWKIKSASDPNHILNPGVLLNRDNSLHLKNIKPLPNVSEKIDLCVECGFCESVCPSKNLTMTPRQRIAVSREIVSMRSKNDPRIIQVLKEYHYDGENTCATDGLCQLSCPVNINTGSYIKSLRESKASDISIALANWCVDHFAFIQFCARTALAKGKFFGDTIMTGISKITQKIFPKFPGWNLNFPEKANKIKPGLFGQGKKMIYFPSCISRIFGAGGKQSMADVLDEIVRSAGIELMIPDGIDTFCCGQPFVSKGFAQAGKRMAEKTISMLKEVSNNGKYSILIDTSPCMTQFMEISKESSEFGLTFMDMSSFMKTVLKKEVLPPLERKILVHPTCSDQKMKTDSDLIAIAKKCAKTVEYPENSFCCGFAGDRGLTHPELTASATSDITEKWKNTEKEVIGYSTSLTCEIGLTTAIQHPFYPIAVLVRDYLNQNNENAN